MTERARIFRKRGQLDRAFAILDGMRGKKASHAIDPRRDTWNAEFSALLGAKGWHVDRCRLAAVLAKARPAWAWPRSLAAGCLAALGRPVPALAQLREAVRLRPARRGYRSRMARAETRLGRCSRAIDVQRGTLDYYPENHWAWMLFGDLQRRCGHPQRALEAYAHVAKMMPTWGRPFRSAGLMRYEVGQRGRAIAAWRRALALNPKDSSLWDRIDRLAPDRDAILEGLRPGPGAIVEAVRASRHAKPLPGASVVWLLDDEASRLMPDGTLKRIVTIVRMAVDRSGRDSLGETRLPSKGMVKVLDAFVIDKQGRRREVTSMHGRRVRYPKITEGAVVVLQYRHIRYPGGYLRQHLATSWYFQHPLGQTRHARWALALPADRKLNVFSVGAVQHTFVRRGAVAIHTFNARDLSPLRPEARSLPVRDLLASVTVSTVPSWDYFSSWGRSLTDDVFEMTPKLTKKLQEITKGATSVGEKVRRVYRYALTRVRYQQDYETFIAGVKPHTAAMVLARGYGDCKDKAVFIIAMLRTLGIKAHFALIRTHRSGRVRVAVPSQQFNHAVAYLPVQPGFPKARFLDATAENLDIGTLRGDDQGTKAFVLFPGGHRFVDVAYQSSRFNHVDVDIALKLDGEGKARGTFTLTARGQQAGRLRKPLANQQVLRQYAQSVLRRVYPGATLIDVYAHNRRSVLKPLIVQIRASFDDAARKDGETLRLRLPKIFSWSALAPWTERRHAVYLGPPISSVGRLTLQIPEGFSVDHKPPDFDVKGSGIHARGKWEWEPQGRTLRYEQHLDRSCSEVQAKDYPAFRGRVLEVARALDREVVFGQKATHKKATH
ncbi:MAG: hypothetical protein KAI47_02770, partial [Deltaproteobacteria bacterium]|nr:hypothetical protein [Deltaproteobacteria bacterium]